MDGFSSTFTFRCDVRSDVVFTYQTGAKETKSDETMQRDLKRGDKVITIGGIHGTIDAVDDSSVFLKSLMAQRYGSTDKQLDV